MDEQNVGNFKVDELNNLMQQMKAIDDMVAYMNALKLELDGEDAEEEEEE